MIKPDENSFLELLLVCGGFGVMGTRDAPAGLWDLILPLHSMHGVCMFSVCIEGFLQVLKFSPQVA